MTRLRILVVAAALAAGPAGAAGAAPAGVGNIAPPVASEGEAATPVHHWHRHCWPVRRWVWTHWGWRYRTVGHRCAPPYRYRYDPYHYRHR
ncbi:MAG TPA: hypothetical protein VIF14_11110 [Alphaproteobacteria bacterium]|jgi:hypothetical protein